MIYCVVHCMVYGMAKRELYGPRYGRKRAVCSTIWPKKNRITHGMVERELYGSTKEAVTLIFQNEDFLSVFASRE